ncbi:hypothetical protein [Spirosoma sp. 209]|uniref:hypothetical protein n=1 Tax=Spirosoma sp. 209 TaxID=1955701 RepID=UPI00098D39E4|nr:hypothetical protein [Spirosoma sp. 209]
MHKHLSYETARALGGAGVRVASEYSYCPAGNVTPLCLTSEIEPLRAAGNEIVPAPDLVELLAVLSVSLCDGADLIIGPEERGGQLVWDMYYYHIWSGRTAHFTSHTSPVEAAGLLLLELARKEIKPTPTGR